MTTIRKLVPLLAAVLTTMAACRNETTSAPEEHAAPAATAPAAGTASDAFVVVALERPSSDVDFKAVLELSQKGVEGVPQLRNAREAVPKEWPASVYATFSTAKGTFACTAALIGPQVMLTAAHCVPSSGTVKFTYHSSYSTTCTQHPQYASSQDPSADFALCKIEQPFAVPAGFSYETVNTSSMDLLVNQPLMLTGYGCISDLARNDRTDGKYRIGSNQVDETSSSSSRRRGAQYYAGQEENNLFTTDDSNMANLCPGDSGGPAFRLSGTKVTQRTIVGINSRVFWKDSAHTVYGSSLISATGGPAFFAWAKDWAVNAEVEACGINGSLTNCRS